MRLPSWSARPLVLILIMAVAPTVMAPTIMVPTVRAQDNADAQREQQIADRFLQVLLRRPRTGTALDRVYGYHVQTGTLDELIQRQETLANESDAGSRYFLIGLLHLQRGQDAEAAKALQRAEEALPDDAMVSFYLGKALAMIGRGDAAAEAYERAIDRKPARNEALPVFTQLGRLYQRAQANDKALKVWERLEATFPGDPRVGEQIAATLAEEGQLDAALTRYESLAERTKETNDFRSVGYLIAAAEIKRKLGRDDEALTDLEGLLQKLRPSSWLYADVRRRIEAGFLRTGNYAQLADYYAKQVEADPDQIQLRLRLGTTLAKAGRLNEAEQSLRETVELAGENLDVRLALVDVLTSAGKPGAGAEQLEAVAKIQPDNPDVLVRLGNLCLDDETVPRDQRRANAAQAWQRLADLRPDDAVVLAQVGDLMRRIERTDAAIGFYEKAITLQPDQPQYREYLGEFLHRNDRKDEALKTWELIAEGERATRPNLIRLAEIYNTFEHTEMALTTFAKAAEMDPTFSERLRYANLLQRSQEYDKALGQLDLADSACETPEETEQVLKARISVYANSGTLNDRIADAREGIENAPNADARQQTDAHRTLAIMLDAATRLPEAIEAIEHAKELSPDDTMVLSINGELYRKAARYGDAIDVFRSLAKLDSRYRSNYLKRIAGLQMQLGQTDEALATAAELIADQPGNPESYRFYADQCFRIGRDEEGIETLRQALRSAPRDREARSALASALALRFRTDEAIELNWQLLVETDEFDEQESLTKTLAELYERKGDFDRLLSRLELHGREESDVRTATLLTAAAHRSVDDFGSAQQTLEPLLAENPRDGQLIEQMVELSRAADDLETALEYQNQLVAIADTVDHRRSLLQLMIDAGQIERAEAMTQRVQYLQDPAEMIRLVDSVMRRGERDAGVRLCESVLQQHPDLWEVRVRLAGLFLLDEKFDDAIAQLDLVDAMTIEPDTLSELKKLAEATTKKPRQTSAIYQQQQQYRSYELAQAFGVGPYASNQFSSSNANALNLPMDDFAQAQYVSLAIRMAIASKQDRFDEFIAELPDVDEVLAREDVNELWTAFQARMLQQVMGPVVQSNPNQMFAKEGQALRQLMWKIAKLDEQKRPNLLMQLVSARTQIRKPHPSLNQEPSEPEPLEDWQLDVLKSYFDDLGKQQTTGYMATFASQSLYEELSEAGKHDAAQAFLVRFTTSPENLENATQSIQFFAGSKRLDDLEAVVRNLQTSLPELSTNFTSQQASSLLAACWVAYSLDDLDRATKDNVVNLAIASQAMADQQKKYSRRSSSQSTGMLNVYLQYNNNYRQTAIQVPFAESILPSSFAQSFYQSLKFGQKTDEANADYQHILNLLDQDASVFPADSPTGATERRLRAGLSAYASWWTGDLQKAYQHVVAASERFGENNDWWIERARMAAELDRPAESLAALDGITPLDQATLRVRELAAINLASKLGKLERARIAAQRLFGMRLDNDTELALSDQLQRLGMRDMAAAVLQRNQRRGGQSVNELLSLARAFDGQDNRDAAAEVAFKALQKINSGKEQNSEYYRRQATDILKKAKRLDALLEQAERRVASAPKSVSLKTELAELYTAAGRDEDANRIIESLAEQQPNDPRTLWSVAEQLAGAGKNAEAVEKYLTAIENEPRILDSQKYYTFERAVHAAKASDETYERLSKIDLKRFDTYVLGRIVSLYRRESRTPTDAAKNFIDQLLAKAPPSSLGELFRNLSSQKEATQTKGFADAVRRIIGDDSLYQANGRFWSSVSFGRGGKLNSSLTACLFAIQADAELEAVVREQLAEKAAKESTGPVASWFLLCLDAKDAESEADVDALVERFEKLKQGSPNSISQYQWWQLGQHFAEYEPTIQLALTTLLHAKKATSRISGLRYENSIDALLTDVYAKAGDRQAARDYLMKAYAEVDNSEQNTYNPGYGDYQDLQSYLGIAQKLNTIDFSIDAIRIVNQALAKPERFANVQRWGGSRLVDQFKAELSKAIKGINETAIKQFLSFNSDKDEATTSQPDTDAAIFRFDVMPLSEEGRSHGSSIATVVMTKAAETESGRALLDDFVDQVDRQLEAYPEDWSLLVANLMVALAREDDDAVDSATALIDGLPEWSDAGPLPTDKLVDLATPALMAMRSTNPEVAKIGVSLCDYALKAAKQAERHEVTQTLVFAKLKLGDNVATPEEMEATLLSLLDTIVPPDETATARNADLANECLGIADSAAKAEKFPLMIEAIRRALRLGPPLRTVSNTTSSSAAFMMSTANRSAFSSGSSDNNDQDLDKILARIEPMVVQLREAIATKPEAVDVDKAFEAFREIVFPPTRKNEVFFYLANLNDLRFRNRKPDELKPNELIQPTSMVGWLVEMASASDRLGELTKLSEKIAADPSSTIDLRLLDLLVAIEKGDEEQADLTLAKFDQLDKNESFNAAMHAAWTMQAFSPNSEPLSQLKLKLFNEASRIKELAEFSDQLKDLLLPMLDTPDALSSSQSDERVDLIANQLVKMTRLRYSNYSGSYGEDRVKDLRAELVEPILANERYDLAGKMLHFLVKDDIGLQNLLPKWLRPSMDLMSLDDETRYSVLSTIAFGNDGSGDGDDTSPVNSAASRFIVDQPGVLSSAPNQLALAEAIPIGHPDFPITSTSLWLAQAAAGCDKTEELIARLTPHIEKPGDEIDAFIGLARLVRLSETGSSDEQAIAEIGQVLRRVTEYLKSTQPNKNVKTSIAVNASLLAARCSDATWGVTSQWQDDVKPLWKTLLIHSRRRFIGLNASFYSIMATRAGLEAAAGATTDAPLKWFFDMQLNYLDKPLVQQTDPLYLKKANSLCVAGGAESSILMFKYPLAGDFEFSHRNVPHGWGNSDNTYGGVVFEALSYNDTAKVAALMYRGSMSLPCKLTLKNKENVYALKVAGDEVTMLINGEPAVTDVRDRSMPFVGIHLRGSRIAEMADIQITGNPTIPREVSLINEQLRGWSATILGARLITPYLPLTTDQDADDVAASRKENARSAEDRYTWYVDSESNELRTGGANSSYNPGGQRHLLYLRPLFAGEKIAYEFFHEPGKAEVHPTIGRVAMLLREKAVKLRWLPQDQSLESIREDALHEIEPDTSLGQFNPIDWKPNDWNTVELVAGESTVDVTVNGNLIGRFEIGLDRRFGLLGEKEREGRIRNVKLSGDWPETLPNDLFEPAQ